MLEAKWKLIKVAGGTELTDADADEAKDLIAGRPRWKSARPSSEQIAMQSYPSPPEPARVASVSASVTQSPVTASGSQSSRWLYSAIDEFITATERMLKPDSSNGDYIVSLTTNIRRAREVMQDVPLDQIRRKELDDWLLSIRAMPSKLTGKPLAAVTIRNLVTAVRVAMTKFAEWEWWIPPTLWDQCFKGYSIKKLQTPAERKRRRKRPPIHTVDEKRVLWHLSTPITRAMMALADWAGHTQMEIATLTFDEVIEENGEMYIDRDRHKTGVHGRWWIPPEAAMAIRQEMAKTPRSPEMNPNGLAFLSPHRMPLVHRSLKGKRTRCDYIGKNIWSSLLDIITSPMFPSKA